MHTVTLDQDGLTLLRRHADWWRRKASLFTTVQGAPLWRTLRRVVRCNATTLRPAPICAIIDA